LFAVLLYAPAHSTSEYNLEIWDFATKQKRFSISDLLIRAIEWSPDSQYLAISRRYDDTLDSGISIYRASDGMLVKHVSSGTAHSIAWSPDGTKIAVDTGTIQVWDPFADPPALLV